MRAYSDPQISPRMCAQYSTRTRTYEYYGERVLCTYKSTNNREISTCIVSVSSLFDRRHFISNDFVVIDTKQRRGRGGGGISEFKLLFMSYPPFVQPVHRTTVAHQVAFPLVFTQYFAQDQEYYVGDSSKWAGQASPGSLWR